MISPRSMEKVCSLAIARWGNRELVQAAIEDCEYLTYALKRFQCGRYTKNGAAAEVVDILIAANQLRLIIGKERVDLKLNRRVAELHDFLSTEQKRKSK